MEAINYQEKPEVQALLFLKGEQPKDLLDCVGLLMIALEECNFHTPLAKLQELTGIKVNQFYRTKWEKVGMELATMLGWCGEACCLTIMASCPEFKDKKSLGLLIATSGIKLTDHKL